jgi:SAM-dependent methyltransferase
MTLTASPIGVEALDDPATDGRLVDIMLRDIAVSNRWFGGMRTARLGVEQLLEPGDYGRMMTLLDIGTGAGDLPLSITRWAKRRGVRIMPVGIERSRAAARLARSNGVATVIGCASALPLGPNSVDIVLLSQLLHHLDDDSAVSVLSNAASVARRGVVIADLAPSRWAALAFRIAGRGLRFHPLTISDGITSIARGRTTSELQLLAHRSGANTPQVSAHPFARVLLTWRTDH